MTIRILVADDHQIVRKGLVMLLESEPDMEVVAEVANGRDAVNVAKEMKPDVVVMDIVMPDMGGIEASSRITSCVGSAIVALSMHSDRHFMIEMFRSGATGFLLKDCATDELVRAIKTVVSGHKYVGPSITSVSGLTLASLVHYTENRDKLNNILTKREREVLQLIAEGCSNREIARRLELSVKTIENHRQNVMNKLNLHSIADLTKYAIRSGLTGTEF